MTDADGVVQFTTIYPGWYSGRTIHIHYRLRVTGTSYDFVSQVFFPETISNQVLANAPYSVLAGLRQTLAATA